MKVPMMVAVSCFSGSTETIQRIKRYVAREIYHLLRELNPGQQALLWWVRRTSYDED